MYRSLQLDTISHQGSSCVLCFSIRRTWDTVVEFGEEVWPYGDRNVWVWSRHCDNVVVPMCRRDQTCVYSESPKEMLAMAKKKGYKHVYVDGGTTIQEFQRCDCIDEYILTRVPLVLGDGIPLFGKMMVTDTSGTAGKEEEEVQGIEMEHLTTTSFSNGLVQSHYRVQKSYTTFV